MYNCIAGDKFSHYLAYPIIIVILKVLIDHEIAGGRYLLIYLSVSIYIYICVHVLISHKRKVVINQICKVTNPSDTAYTFCV